LSEQVHSAAASATTPAAAAETAPADHPERLLRYRFTRPELLREALTHPSALAQSKQARRRSSRHHAPPRHYERLEFLGDRVLGLVVADLLWRRFDNEPEGPLTRRHGELVRRDTLASIVAEIGLDRFVQLSPAEAASGRARSPSVRADVLEAVIAAIYLDGGFTAAVAFVERLWGPRVAAMTKQPPRDPKTLLQEWAQGRGLPLPIYRLAATTGPDHARQFTVAVRLADSEEATATASSKRSAETAAAAALLDHLGQKTMRNEEAATDPGDAVG
jgi:ribonuclease III